ncbi:MAG: lytic transglycosylase domain-containing protein [Alkalispirochaetaceae bacterium]
MTNRFLIVLSAAFLLGCSTSGPFLLQQREEELETYTFSATWSEELLPGLPGSYENVGNLLESDTPMLSLYREDLTHDAVVRFFLDLTGDPEIAMPILYHADRADLPLSIVFSLAFVESRFSRTAVNQNPTSIDRGVFQLNSLTFRDLTEEDFFDPDISAFHGTEYLSWCFEQSPEPRVAVAIYNAGRFRVINGLTPDSTKIYVQRVFAYREQLLERFRRYIGEEFPITRT